MSQSEPVAYLCEHKNHNYKIVVLADLYKTNPAPHYHEVTPLHRYSSEPVAWRVEPHKYGVGSEGVYAMTSRAEQRDMWIRKGWQVEPMYVREVQ